MGTLKFFAHLSFWLLVHVVLAHLLVAFVTWEVQWLWDWLPGARAALLVATIWIAAPMLTTEHLWHRKDTR
jgi:membrane-bound metal-dependent hydrolase YbcI (DUF457 family)